MRSTLISILLLLFTFHLKGNNDSLFIYNKIAALEDSIYEFNSSLKKTNQSLEGFSKAQEILKGKLESLNQSSLLFSNNISDLEKKISGNLSKIDNNSSNLKSIEKRLADNLTIINSKIAESNELIERNYNKLMKETELNKTLINMSSNEFKNALRNSESQTKQSLLKLNEVIDQNSLYWIISVLMIFILLLTLYILLRKSIFKNKSDLEQNLQNTRKNLEEESIKLDNKLVELLEAQLNVKKNQESSQVEEKDHSLALKVADEIIRIQKNLERMDGKTKGLKQLTASVKRIQDNFAANGYEIVEMLGKPYFEGMKVTANFIPDENLKDGEQIISRIIKPQVNYREVMIQSAQIEVSQRV